MSIGTWIRRVLGREGARRQIAPVAEETNVAANTASPAPLEEDLSRVGTPEGPSETRALLLLDEAAGTAKERLAIAAIGRAMTLHAIPDRVACRCACILADRGDREGALRFLEQATRSADLLFRADLLYETGQVTEAMVVLEQLLAEDIGLPGALERHGRWSQRVGHASVPKQRRDEETVAIASVARAPVRILREAARGGCGTVYEAQDETLGRPVAFKVYHRVREDQPQLEREARTAVALRGPGVARVYDVSYTDGWLALEWASLGSVRDLLAIGRHEVLFPIEQWALPLAKALARVHAAGFVHADVKPSNVLLRAPDDPILCDFGISVPAGSASVGGSAGFLSPERMAGQPVSSADDVFGFGRILEDVVTKANAIQAPSWVRELMHACLAPIAERPANGAELVERLSRELRRGGQSASVHYDGKGRRSY